MPTLKEVLADKAKYQDNLAWQLENGVSVTLGQLRQLSTEAQTEISKREQAIEASRAAIATEEAKLKKSQLDTANVYTTLSQAVEAVKAGRYDDPALKQIFGNNPVVTPNGTVNQPDPYAELARLEGDTLLGPVVKYLKQVNERATKAEQAVANNLKIQENMATSYINGTLEDRYDRLVPIEKQDKITLESLIRDAVQNKEFRSDNTPDIRRAYKRATAVETQASHDAEVAAAAVKKYQEEHPAGEGINVPSPSNIFGLDVHNKSGSAPKPFASLDEAFKAAAADKDIWSQVDQITH
jgi:hypothetical protein